MHKCEMTIFWNDESEAFIADVPELAYCSAFGDTLHEALDSVCGAMEGVLNVRREFGKSIPEPKGRRLTADEINFELNV